MPETKIDASDVRKSLDDALQKLDGLIDSLQQERVRVKDEIDNRIEELQLSRYDTEQIDGFLKEPYVIIPKRENEFYVIAPKWVDFQIGWLERSTKSYNIFVCSQYMQWIAQIPETLQEKLKFPEPLPLKVYDGMLLTGKEHQDRAWDKYKRHLRARRGKDRIAIKRGHEFKLVASLIEDGILPFIPTPVDENDLREWNNGLELRPYQCEAWDQFLNNGAMGLFWPFGAGKSLFGVYALAQIKGEKLVVVPTLTLKEQWNERIQSYIPEFKDEIRVETYHAYDKLRNREFSLICFDECQHLPANTFVRLSTLKAKYRLGFSGSPFREDKRENYIFALTGFPIGISWDELIKLQVVRKPTFKLYILQDNRAKLRKLGELLRLPLKPIVFCDSIQLGKRIAQKFELPFVYGETRGRLDIIRESDACVVSRVGDEGISLPDIERVIEISFLFGSRMQESQRFGRLMHATKEEPEHIILMSEREFDQYQKRLYAITERGFKIEVIR